MSVEIENPLYVSNPEGDVQCAVLRDEEGGCVSPWSWWSFLRRSCAPGDSTIAASHARSSRTRECYGLHKTERNCPAGVRVCARYPFRSVDYVRYPWLTSSTSSSTCVHSCARPRALSALTERDVWCAWEKEKESEKNGRAEEEGTNRRERKKQSGQCFSARCVFVRDTRKVARCESRRDAREGQKDLRTT